MPPSSPRASITPKQTELLLRMTVIVWTFIVVVTRLTSSLPLSKILIDVTFAAMVGWMAGLLVEKFIGWTQRTWRAGFANWSFSIIHRWGRWSPRIKRHLPVVIGGISLIPIGYFVNLLLLSNAAKGILAVVFWFMALATIDVISGGGIWG